MSWLLPELDPSADEPIAERIAAFYGRAIRDGRLRAGERLPPIRDVAAACGVARATAQDAYRRLATDGFVAGAVGRGTIVLEQPATAAALDEVGGRFARLLSPYALAALRSTREMPRARELPPNQPLVANFAELAPDDGRFPVDDWRQAMDAALRAHGSELLGYGHSTAGLVELRTLLAERTHDVDAGLTAADVLVTAGAQQALDLALRTLCAPGDTVIVTTPSYHQMHGLMRAHGLQVAPVPFGPEGLDLAQLELALARPSVRLCYLMPTFHNPTGRTLDLAQRRRVIELLARTSVAIVEDEYQWSLRCRGEPLPTLRSLDPRGMTVTVSTVSKELFPALRIGWVAGNQGMLRPMAAVKRFMDLETSALLQAALVEFLKSGALDRHLAALRAELGRRHVELQRAAAVHLPPGCVITAPDGGFVAWLELPEPGHGDRLAELAVERGVRVVPGSAFDPTGAPSRGVRLSLTRADRHQIDAGMRVLGDSARELLGTPVAARPFL